MKIPIQLSFKLFNETTTVKITVEDLHIGQTMEMYQKVMIPLFGVENYENTILQMAHRIKEKRSRLLSKPTIIPPTPIRITNKVVKKEEPLSMKLYDFVDNLFK